MFDPLGARVFSGAPHLLFGRWDNRPSPMEFRCRFRCVWKLGDQEVAQFSDLSYRVVTVSGSSEKLFEDVNAVGALL